MRKISITQVESDCKPIQGTGEILVDLSGTRRKRPWSKRKMENRELVKILEAARRLDESVISPSRLAGVRDCASWLLFAEQEGGGRRLVKANFCRLRLCPMCAWRRSLKLFSQVSAITDAILADKKARFIFVTLTVRNCGGDMLRDTIARMGEGFKRLVQSSKDYRVSAVFRKNLMGYMKAIEVTYNTQENSFHPHIHAIFEVRPSYFGADGYMTHGTWRDVMGLDYTPQVDVRAIKNSTVRAVAEAAKYPVKLDGLLKITNKERAARVLIQLKTALHGCRLVTFGGDFREYKRQLALDDVERGDLVHVETEKKELNAVAMVLFRFRADAGAYIC